MESVVLTKENIGELQGRTILCWGLARYYLTAMFEAFGLEERIDAIVDNTPKVHGTATIIRKEIPVVSPEYLRQADGKLALIITCDYNDEILEQIMREGYLDGKDCTFYRYASKREQIDLSYRKKYATVALENIILFRSGPMRKNYIKGADFWDNARALFEYMVRQNYNQTYKLVWLVKNPEEFEQYANIENVEFQSFDWEDTEDLEKRDRYYHDLCLAKYIFTTDAYDFAKNARKDQVRIQLWHGCGFKTRALFLPCEKRYEYTTVISELYAKIHADIYGLRMDQVKITGYAKHDWLFQPYDGDLSEVLGIPRASKYIFWLPTFRMADDKESRFNQYELNPDTGLPIVINQEQLEQLNNLLKEADIMLIVKLHPIQKNVLVKDYELSNIAIIKNYELTEKDLVINRLLASADALISDYSSTAVDYLVLDRPIGFTLDDVEEYKNSRGFVFDPIEDWLPGKKIFNFDDFCEFIKEIAVGEDSQRELRHSISEKMVKYKDAYNCKRILDAFGIEK